MENNIIEILKNLMACASVTNTEKEIAAETWMIDYFRRLPYYRKYPEHCGLFPIPGDPLRRSTVWALVKGCEPAEGTVPGPCAVENNAAERNGKEHESSAERVAGADDAAREGAKDSPAVIFLGHHDVVSADVYGDAAPWAFDPEAVTAHLVPEQLTPEAYTDLLSGEWIFGRGSCDMLGGTAAQMAVLAGQAEAVLAEQARPTDSGASQDKKATGVPGRQAKAEAAIKKENAGSLLFISVPDEETFSAGMRGTLPLLEQLKETFHLDYRLAVCGEPNQRLADGKTQVIHTGSIGKLLPVVLVQGRLVQIGSYRDGVNPLGILSRIVASTEGDETFTEEFGGERSVPPVWMYARDLKDGYDFSLPRQAAGYCNVLTFHKTPAQVAAYFLEKIQGAVKDAPHPVAVMTWVTLWQQAKQRDGFAAFWRDTEKKTKELLQKEKKTFPEVTLWLMRQTLQFLQTDKPLVLFGFAPPYYPAVRSEEMRDAGRFAACKKAAAALQQIVTEPYFPGVSDCSYCGLADTVRGSLYQANTPLWGRGYHFDMEALERLQIPFFLWGPWGRDLHQAGERVNRYSLTEEYPSVLRKLLQCVWLLQ